MAKIIDFEKWGGKKVKKEEISADEVLKRNEKVKEIQENLDLCERSLAEYENLFAKGKSMELEQKIKMFEKMVADFSEETEEAIIEWEKECSDKIYDYDLTKRSKGEKEAERIYGVGIAELEKQIEILSSARKKIREIAERLNGMLNVSQKT
jgi:hypothetical protein